MTQLTQEELQQIKDIREQYNNVVTALGELELQKQNVLARYNNVLNQEQTLAKTLSEKYGDGVIDINTGEIKPHE
jgi:hypothetical protein